MPETTIPITINPTVEMPITVTDDAVEIAVEVVEPVVIELSVISAASESASFYTHSQAVAATNWTINHNLGYRPSIRARTSGGLERIAQVVHVSANQAIITFLVASTGTADCS